MNQAMNRRAFVTVLGALLAAPRAAEAQQAKKVPRIGVLTGPVDPGVEAFRQGLRELGYVERENIAIERRSAEGKLDRLPDLAAELVRLKPDVIVASSNLAIMALQKATQTIPIVMAVVGDVVGAGFVASLARPGGNITGLTVIAEQLSRKRLELLKEINPKITRVAVFRNPSNPTYAVLWEETRSAATALGIRVFPLDIRGPNDLDGAFGTIAREHVEGLIVLPEPVSFTKNRSSIWQPRPGCRRCIHGTSSRTQADSWPIPRTGITCGGDLPRMSTRFSKAPSPLIFQSNSPRSSISWST
jgi:putative ABC transport system substrate-binding protein